MLANIMANAFAEAQYEQESIAVGCVPPTLDNTGLCVLGGGSWGYNPRREYGPGGLVGRHYPPWTDEHA